MPLYEFRCAKCDHVEEVLQKFNDPAPDPCPECEAKGTMSRDVSLTSFQLKGGGWYKDLYSSTPKDGGKGGDGKSSDAKSSEAKSDKKAGADKPTSKKGGETKSPAKPAKGGSTKAAA